jgi:hypothetical protein
LKGNEKEKDDLATITIKAFARYDTVKAAEYFIIRPEDREKLNRYADLPRYESYLERLRQTVEEMKKIWTLKKELLPIKNFVPLVFTDHAFFILNQQHDGLLRKIFLKHKEEIKIDLFKRLEGLFTDEGIKKEIKARLEGFLRDREEAINRDRQQNFQQTPVFIKITPPHLS